MFGEALYFSISARKMSINILNGIKWNFINIKQIMRKRIIIQKSRVISDKKIKEEMETFSFSFKVFLKSHYTPILPRIMLIKSENHEEIILK